MGPNGFRKNNNSKCYINNPVYTKTNGNILFDGEDITDLKNR